MSAIARMKATAGIDIFHEVAPKHNEMMKRLALPQSLSYNPIPMDTIMVVFEEWLAGKSQLSPTWAELMAVLREIGVNHIVEWIEKYFAGEQFQDPITHLESMHAALFLGYSLHMNWLLQCSKGIVLVCRGKALVMHAQ